MNRRAIIVALLSLLSIALWAPDVSRAFGHRVGMPSIAPQADGDEIALIERMANAAGAAYDRLEAKALRQQLLSTASPPLAAGS